MNALMIDNKIQEHGSSQNFESQAWLLRGITSQPGTLILSDTQLAFVAESRGSMLKFQLRKLEKQTGQFGIAARLKNEEATIIFELNLNEIEIIFPWYVLSCGMNIRANGVLYRISFAKPEEGGKTKSFAEFRRGRFAGKKWQALLPSA